MRFDPLGEADTARLVYPPYLSTHKRGPLLSPIRLGNPAVTQLPLAYSASLLKPFDADLTVHGQSAPLGEKIVVSGCVRDEDGQPVRNSLIEVWQCNSAGRYWHKKDQHDAPLDPNFFGFGKFFTDKEGRYRFITIKPGPYPWGNHHKAWRPAHIHFSLFGNVMAQRLVTQMYFPADPLFEFDPIYQSIEDPAVRERLVSRFSIEETVDDKMLGYVFDIVLRGRDATPFER